MRNYILYGNIDSRDYGAYIFGAKAFNAPARAFEYIKVPGRDGDLIGLDRSIGNISVTYPVIIISENDTYAIDFLNDFRAELLAVKGYERLEDSYNPDEYRLAVLGEEIDVSATDNSDIFKFNLIFNCKPQRYLTSGETVITKTANSSTVDNPTAFESKPKITVTGYGDMYINSQKITIANVYPSVTIDSDMGDCYSGVNNANHAVTFQGNEFPTLVAGSNAITKANTITKIEITPRWWRV